MKAMYSLASLYNRFISAYQSPERGTSSINRYIYAKGYGYLMTEDKNWADSAISAMEQVPAYLNAYGTSPDSVADSLEALSIGFDWCYDRIVEQGKKEKFIELIHKYAKSARNKFEKDIYTDFHNYALNFINSMLFAGLALWGEDDMAEKYLDWAIGIMENGYSLNGTIYKTLDSIDYVDGACNWEGPSYQRRTLFRILKYVDALDTATGGLYDLWHTKFSKLENAGYYIMYMTLPNDRFINIGDVSSAKIFYQDINNMASLQGKYQNGYFSTFLDSYFQWEGWTTQNFKPVIPCDQGYQYQIFYLIWYNPDIRPKPLNQLPLTKKFGDTIIMRSGWEDNDTIITFKSGIHWGGHSQLDHGSFTIYKNAPLAIDSGYYDLWNPGTHIWDYWKRTIAHNSIIIYDARETCPSYAGKRINDGGQRMAFRKYNPPYSDRYGYFSSGSTNEPLSNLYLNRHLDEFKMGDMKAYETKNDYDYIYTDITNAYNNTYKGKGDNQPAKVEFVEREFVYLKPNYIVIFDRVRASDPSYEKAWLLHCGQYKNSADSAPHVKTNEGWKKPMSGISKYNSNLIRIDNENGRLFLKTLAPDPHELIVVGGDKYEFWVNNKNVELTSANIRDGEEPGAWRIEIRPNVKQKNDVFLNVLYPCDSSVKEMPPSCGVESEESSGVRFSDKVVVFSKNKQRVTYAINGNAVVGHIVCSLKPNTAYSLNIKNGDTKEEDLRKVVSTKAGIVEFESLDVLGKTLNISLRCEE